MIKYTGLIVLGHKHVAYKCTKQQAELWDALSKQIEYDKDPTEAMEAYQKLLATIIKQPKFKILYIESGDLG